MSEITLSDFVGYVFSEMVRARDIADRESKRIATLYAQDEIMKHFSVPRFKIPEMELTIPVLISGARFSSVFAFLMREPEFNSFISGKLENAMASISLKERDVATVITTRPTTTVVNDLRPIPTTTVTRFGTTTPILRPREREVDLAFPMKQNSRKGITAKNAVASTEAITNFYRELINNNDATQPDNIIKNHWPYIFVTKAQEAGKLESYRKFYPNNELCNQTQAEVTEKIKQNTGVLQTRIENLLVNPETNMVKTGSTEASVFQVRAKIVEEGIFIKTIREEGQPPKQVIEFE